MQLSNLSAKEQEKLKKLGVRSVLDLALIIPKNYTNTHINQNPLIDQINTVHVKVQNCRMGPKALSITFFCETWQEQIYGVVFQPRAWHRKVFRVGESLHVQGKIQWQNGRLTLLQPQVITEINTIVPKYKTPLQNRSMIALVEKYLTREYLIESGLNEDQVQTLLNLHFPSLDFVQKISKEGLGDQELLVLKFVEIFNHIQELSKKKRVFTCKHQLQGDVQEFIKALPFVLTNDQQKAIEDIKADFRSQNAARRIVMGDVGSGKTMVILAAVMMCYPKRAVLMAPTTILAQQLYDEASLHLPKSVKKVLVVQSTSKNLDFEAYDFIIGTHALLHRDLPEFDLVMVDEQHRFGTKQRELINQLSIVDNKYPHFLQFSATPIPRTMSMIQSSLVDFSFLKETPFEKNIDTKIIRRADFKALSEHIRKEADANRQSIVIYPLVQESEVIAYQSIEEGRGYWEKNFEQVYVTYGADKNKEEILLEFRKNGKILIATTLVEVGISLPKLSTIVIVGAERLGLATLHQLRGRVSRNGLRGYCFLYTNLDESARLEAFTKTQNGFDIAELDLKFRQGGDILGGVRQSGQKFLFYDFEEDILEEAKRRLGA